MDQDLKIFTLGSLRRKKTDLKYFNKLAKKNNDGGFLRIWEKSVPRGNGHQHQRQQKILVKVDKGKLLNFSIMKLLKNFREVSFFEGAKQNFKEQ